MKLLITYIKFSVASCICLKLFGGWPQPKRSKNFEINGIICYWVVSDPEFPTWSLKNSLTDNVLLEIHVDDPGFDIMADTDSIEKFNTENFIDLNFDQFKDFRSYSKGSMPMTSMTTIYLFNKATRKFDAHDELSDTSIEEIDSAKRKLVTNSFRFDGNTRKIHHFKKSGKLRYSEIITTEYIKNEDSADFNWTTYEKVVNQKVKMRKRYLTKSDEE